MKKIIFTLIFVLSFFLANNTALALKKPLFSNIVINTVDNTLSGELLNSEPNVEIIFTLYDQSKDPYTSITQDIGQLVEWKTGYFSTNIGNSLLGFSPDVNGTKFIGNIRNPPLIYDTLLMDVGEEDNPNIQNREHVGFTIISSGNTENQNTNVDTQQNVHIDIKKDESSLEQKNINNHSFYYYHVKGSVGQIEYQGHTIYLVIKKKNGPKKLLCSYQNGIGKVYDSPLCLGRDFKTDDFLTEPGDYQYYFTLDNINGSAISRVIDLTTPIPSPSSETSTNTEQENTAQENTQTQQHETPASSYSTHTDNNYGNLGDGGLVGTDCGYHLGPGKNGRICTFSDLMSLIARVIDYIFVLILPIAAIIFAYVGYLYITSGGNAEKRTAAKKAMTYLVVGVVVIMMAWLLVKTLLVSLGVSAGFTLFLDI